LHVVATSSEGASSAASSADIAVIENLVAEPASLAGTATAVSGK
jgi:hypothetical protein